MRLQTINAQLQAELQTKTMQLEMAEEEKSELEQLQVECAELVKDNTNLNNKNREVHMECDRLEMDNSALASQVVECNIKGKELQAQQRRTRQELWCANWKQQQAKILEWRYFDEQLRSSKMCFICLQVRVVSVSVCL